MKTSDFDYELPADRIAQQPLTERDAARMLVLDPRTDELIDSTVRELPSFLAPGDLLVFNDSRVLPARLIGTRDDGGEAEVLLLRPVDSDAGRWEALTRPRRRLPVGALVRFPGSSLTVGVIEQRADSAVVSLRDAPDVMAEVRRVGRMPTPPYIKQRLADPERYQTVYAREEGSAAAPTAGLHFTPGLLEAIRARGVELAFVTLHVGLDTFRPVRDDDPAHHPMHREWYRIDEATAAAVAAARDRKGRVVAVGTTCVRVLESAARDSIVAAGEAWTSLLILPGHRFRVVDAMVTNFHLPKSTLLMLVSAFAGTERIMRAYRKAIDRGYRFYSFGDCMFIKGRGSA
ncbi:MAG TPA: tRNA preQ1(34) S-adenosylmethionine ribosyltransferase-isomerase QueA [Candidatus Dormibacteraeota bacterium]